MEEFPAPLRDADRKTLIKKGFVFPEGTLDGLIQAKDGP